MAMGSVSLIAQVRVCKQFGIFVHKYIHWSLFYVCLIMLLPWVHEMLWWMGYDCFVLMCHQWLWCYMASVLVNKHHCDCMQTIQIDNIYCEARTMVTEWSIYSDQSWSSQYSYKRILLLWASSTDLTAVSKFKPHQPAQWALGTHRKGPSRMEKVTSRMNWPIRNSTQIRNKI